MSLTFPSERSNINFSDKVIDASDFYSEAIYQRELRTIFRHSWLFVGHESMMPNRGDFITTYMADDAVIVCRDKNNKIQVLLNKCRHRGNKVCLFDKGNSEIFQCSYHGWNYDCSGALKGVPLSEEVYGNDFRRSDLGLISAQVSTYKGLIFANWDAEAPALEQYLGKDLLWYLDNFLLDADSQGLQVLPGLHRYLMPVNWKLLAENFGGDQYHFSATHGSLIAATKAGGTERINFSIDRGTHFSVVANGTAPHGVLQLAIGENFYQDDLAQAKSIGEDAVTWVMERYQRQQKLLCDIDVKPYSFRVANIFPNFSLIGVGTAFYGRGFILWQPRGPQETEVWEWCLVEKSAPQLVKERMAFVLGQRQSAAGLVAPDDHENFERISDSLNTNRAKEVRFIYQLGTDAEKLGSVVPQLPGNVQPQISESYQRAFYKHWSQVIVADL